MKRILSLLLSLFLLCGIFVSCSGEDDGDNDLPPNDGENERSVITDLKIDGVDISEFTIIYGTDGSESLTRYNGKWIESARYKDVAEAIAEEIYKLTEQRLNVKPYSASMTQYEILVGNCPTRSAQDGTFYEELGKITDHSHIDDYTYGVFGSRLILLGGSANASYTAAKEFIKACKKMDGSDFTASPVSGKAKLIRVACIGDSITNGAKSSDENYYSYPVQLQKMLGYDYYVGNFGHNGIRVTNYASDSSNYPQSLDLKPDVIFFMLGTNDSNPGMETHIGTPGYKELYNEKFDELIKAYQNVNSNVQIFIMTPPNILNSFQYNLQVKLTSQINREIATKHGFKLIDNYTVSERDAWELPDNTHPNDATYLLLAENVYARAKKTIITEK